MFKRLNLPSFSWRRAAPARDLADLSTGRPRPTPSTMGLRRGARWLSVACERLIDLVLPPQCAACGRELDADAESGEADAFDGGGLCGGCVAAFAPAAGPVCPRCAAPLPPIPELPCPFCRERRYRFDAAVALGEYRGAVRRIVLRMKYERHAALTMAVGRILAARLAGGPDSEAPDVVAPVPTHWWRRLIRGASAAELLAEVVGNGANLPVVPRLLECRRATRKQGTLSPGERLVNMRGAFAVSDGYDVRALRILLVDDVLTTGATADAAARALRAAGAASVRVAVVARGTGRARDDDARFARRSQESADRAPPRPTPKDRHQT